MDDTELFNCTELQLKSYISDKNGTTSLSPNVQQFSTKTGDATQW